MSKGLDLNDWLRFHNNFLQIRNYFIIFPFSDQNNNRLWFNQIVTLFSLKRKTKPPSRDKSLPGSWAYLGTLNFAFGGPSRTTQIYSQWADKWINVEPVDADIYVSQKKKSSNKHCVQNIGVVDGRPEHTRVGIQC